MLDTRYSLLDALHLRTRQNIIEHRISSIENQVPPDTSNQITQNFSQNAEF